MSGLSDVMPPVCRSIVPVCPSRVVKPMLCNTGYESAVYSGRSVDMLRRSRAKACFKETAMPAVVAAAFLLPLVSPV